MTVTSQSRFKWNDDKLINLKKSLPEFESSYVKFSVLGQLPPRKIAPPAPKLILTQILTGEFFLRGKFFLLLSGCPPTLKLTLTLTKTPTLTWGNFPREGGEGVNCPDTKILILEY